MNMKDIIIDKLKENTSLTIMEINDLLGLTSIEEYQSLENALDSLVSDGILYYSEKKKKYLLLENSHLVKGNLILNDKGFGFINIGKDSKDVYVSRDNINGAIPFFSLKNWLNKYWQTMYISKSDISIILIKQSSNIPFILVSDS